MTSGASPAAIVGDAPLRILSIATLFPDATRPNFGIFVERSLAALAGQLGVALTIVAPLGLPPWPLSLHPRYRALRALPHKETWHGLTVLRPRFMLVPGMARRNAAAVAGAVLPIARRMMRDDSIDVVDAQFFWPDGPAAQRVARAIARPYSVKARGADIAVWAQRRDTAPLIRDAAHGAAGLLSVGRALKADMVAAGMPDRAITVHYTGLDAERFYPLNRAECQAGWDVAGDGAVLLTVGALIPRKGQDRVIAAMAMLPADTCYLIAGGGEDLPRLRQLVEAAGLDHRVRFLGPVANALLPTLYSAADVMVMPSASEGLANAWVEALACGTPLVLGDITPAHEMLDNDAAGRIAGPDAVSLANAIAAVLAAAPDRQALAAQTRARFSWERNGIELAQHLRQCAAQR